MVTTCYGLVILLSTIGGPTLPGSLLRPHIPHQTQLETPITEVYPPSYPCPDLSGPTDAKTIGEDNVIKDEGPLGVPSPSKYSLPF